MKQTIQRAIPPTGLVGLFGFLYLLMFILGFLDAQIGWPGGFNTHLARALLILGTGFVYGGIRAWSCFPLTSQSFYMWFKTTPWKQGMSLPFGFAHMHLVWADAIIPLILFAIEWNNPYIHATWMVNVFLGGYLLVHMPIFSWSKDHGLKFLLAVGFGLFIWLLQFTQWALVVLVVMYAIAVWGHRRLLAKFPWSDESKPEKFQKILVIGQKRDQAAEIGATYPVARSPYLMKSEFEVLAPVRPAELSVWRSVQIAVMIGWFLFVALDLLVRHADSLVPGYNGIIKASPGMFLTIAGLAAFARILAYVHAAKAPIGCYTRVLTGNLIIPKYDIIFVGPLVCSALGILVFFIADRIGVYSPVCIAIGTTLVIFGMLVVKPSMIDWRLVGHNHPRILRGPVAFGPNQK